MKFPLSLFKGKNEKIVRGVFASDFHIPYHIPLKGWFDFVKDFEPHYLVLGGDIVDAEKMLGVDSFPAEAIETIAIPSYRHDLQGEPL